MTEDVRDIYRRAEGVELDVSGLKEGKEFNVEQ